jgi:hypothetical protein
MKPLRSAPLRTIVRAVLVGRINLRPEPGSRVTLIPTHTQGAGMPVSGLPVKGNSPKSTPVSVTATHSQVLDSNVPERWCCPNVAR